MNSLSKMMNPNEIPDLSLLAILSQMDALGRLNAHQVCPAWYHRVREVNRTVPSFHSRLTIEVSNEFFPFSLKDTERNINFGDLGDSPAERRLTKTTQVDGNNAEETTEPLYPLHPPLTRWNCIQFCDQTERLTTEKARQIASAFPVLEGLTFCNQTGNAEMIDHLVELLKRLKPTKLTSLTVINGNAVFSQYNPIDGRRSTCEAFWSALNTGLPELKHLSLKCFSDSMGADHLPFLRRLQSLVLDWDFGRDSWVVERNVASFLGNLRRHANSEVRAEPLQIDFQNCLYLASVLVNLGDDIRSGVSRLQLKPLNHSRFPLSRLPFRLVDYPNLVSLTLSLFAYEWPGLTNNLASQPNHLPRLTVLRLTIDYQNLRDREEVTIAFTIEKPGYEGMRFCICLPGRSAATFAAVPFPPRLEQLTQENFHVLQPPSPLPTVQALTLRLTNLSPTTRNVYQLHWLSLKFVLPGLQAIHLESCTFLAVPGEERGSSAAAAAEPLNNGNDNQVNHPPLEDPTSLRHIVKGLRLSSCLHRPGQVTCWTDNDWPTPLL